MLLYIHIPFCDSKCSYCSFNSYVDKFHLKRAYMQALIRQLHYELERFNVSENSIETVFIGGGTPSTVAAELYSELFKVIQPYLQKDIEITSEANPNSATPEWLEGMQKLGVNRISFGVQSFDNDKLKALNRAHKADEAIKAIQNAHKIGFKNISLDLIYATAFEDKQLLERDLATAFSLPINHLSAYALTIEEGTPFAKTPEVAKEKLKTTEWFLEKIKEKFEQYEISNFGTYKSKHNIGYWQGKEYIGLGSGAVGFFNQTRYYPTPNIEAYIENPLDIISENLSEEDLKLEKIFLGLRSFLGFEKKILNPSELERAAILVQEQKLQESSTHFINTNFLLADEIALYISS